MSVMSVREFNANVSRAIAMVEAGEAIEISKNGKIVAELRPKRTKRSSDPAWYAAMERLMEDIDKGVPFGRTFSYDERTA